MRLNILAHLPSLRCPPLKLVVHVHAPSARGSALLDAAVATLSARHSAAKHQREPGALRRGADARMLPGGGCLSFARLSAVDAGVTARLDVVDEDALPALLLYRAGKLMQSRVHASLPSMPRAAEEDDREGRKGGGGGGGRGGGGFGGGGDGGGGGGGVRDCDDLDQLADELEDLLDDLGLYE